MLVAELVVMEAPASCVMPFLASNVSVASVAPVFEKFKAVLRVILPAPLAPAVGFAVVMVTLVPPLIADSMVDFNTSLVLMPAVS